MTKTVSYEGRTYEVRSKLPKSASSGQRYAIKTKRGRIIIFEKTSKTGFGSWVIRANFPQ